MSHRVFSYGNTQSIQLIRQKKKLESVSLLTRDSDEEKSSHSISQLLLWFHAKMLNSSMCISRMLRHYAKLVPHNIIIALQILFTISLWLSSPAE